VGGSIYNTGTKASGASFTSLYQIRNSAGTQVNSGVVSTPAIGAGSGTGISFPASAITQFGAGTYTARICADMNGAGAGTISESNESDNCGSWTTISVIDCTPSLSASKTTVHEGETTDLNWSVPASCASSCTFSDGKTLGTSGAYTVKPPTPDSGSTVSYSVTCPSGSSNTSIQVPITVIVPTVDIKANGQDSGVRVDQDQADNVSVSWSSQDVTSCTITKDGASWKTGISSSGVSESVTHATTYAADCVNDYGTHATDSVTVDVIPSFNEF
jgi:hypothetical protein